MYTSTAVYIIEHYTRLYLATRIAIYTLLYKGLLLYSAKPSTPIAYLLLSYNNYLSSVNSIIFHYTIGTLVAIGSYNSFGLPATYPPYRVIATLAIHLVEALFTPLRRTWVVSRHKHSSYYPVGNTTSSIDD